MDPFKALTRGIRFDSKKFSSEAKKFGLTSKSAVISSPSHSKVELPSISDLQKRPDPESDSDADAADPENAQCLTLLGDIKIQPKKKQGKKEKSASKVRQIYQEKVNHFRNANHIHVGGQDVPDPVDSWAKFDFEDKFLDCIQQFYASPTPIQMQCVPMILERREVLACAPTGSGKTAAFLIPLIHLLKNPSKKGFRVVIVAPTRELALQIHREATKLGSVQGIRALVLDGMSKVTKKFNEDTGGRYDILVTTPNKLVYMINDKKISLTSVEWLVIDESDKLFESGPKGFRDQLATIYRACEQKNVRRAMFSATLAPDVESWCKLNLDNVVSVTIGVRNTATQDVEQKLVYAGTEKGKLYALKELIKEGIQPPVLIFVQTKERAQELNDVLSKENPHIRVDSIHSKKSQLQRDNLVKKFRSGRLWILICTELLGRGIDFKGVNLVINYDFPPSTVSYIHRIGRTGRAGRRGKAVTLFTNEDKVLLRSIASVIQMSGGEVPEYMLKLKKASRKEKRKLARSAVERKSIAPQSKYDLNREKKREAMIAASKRRKRKLEEQESSNNDNVEKLKPTKKKKKINSN